MTNNNPTPSIVNSKDDQVKHQPKPEVTGAATTPQSQSNELSDDVLDTVAGGGIAYNGRNVAIRPRP